MPRKPQEPWYWTERRCWVVQYRRKRVVLARGPNNGKTRAEAKQAFHEMMAREGRGPRGKEEPGARMTIDELLDLFSHRPLNQVTAQTNRVRRSQFKRFRAMFGVLAAESIKPHQVANWEAAQRQWNDQSRRAFLQSLKAAYRWGIDMGYLEQNPISRLKMPRTKAKAKELRLTIEQFREILAATTDRQFRDLVTFTLQTGCRPSEVARITAADLDLPNRVAVLKEHKVAHKTDRPRTIYLNDAMAELCGELAQTWPRGPIFRNTEDAPWRCRAINRRFEYLRMTGKVDIPKGAGIYSARHLFVTDALQSGLNPSTVAALVGHASLDMLSRYYDHIDERHEHLKTELARVRPAEGEPAGPKPPAPASLPTIDAIAAKAGVSREDVLKAAEAILAAHKRTG